MKLISIKSPITDSVKYPKWLTSQGKLNGLAALVLFKHCEQLAEDAGNIAPINFVDDKIEFTIRLLLSIETQFFKDTVAQDEVHLPIDRLRSKTLQKIFIPIGWMKATHSNDAMNITTLSKNTRKR